MIGYALAGLLAAMSVQPDAGSSIPQIVAPVPATAASSPLPAPNIAPVQLEDVQVTGRSLDSLIDTFVNEVAAPNRNRGLARWTDRICVGVANLKPETAQYIVDRVSTVAEDVGLRPGTPGCSANVLIIASDDPSTLADTITRDRARAFSMGGAGMDRGLNALGEFTVSDRPVRWWQVSMPVDSQTGQRAVRIPGDCLNSCTHSNDYAPATQTFAASRLSTQIVDSLFRTIIILDVNQVSRVSVDQLSDYVAMITLAQIDPDADTSEYASILNVFQTPESAPHLTNWDLAYLHGLYEAERTQKTVRAGNSEIASAIHRAHDRLRTAQE